MIKPSKLYIMTFIILFIVGFSISVSHIQSFNNSFVSYSTNSKNLASSDPKSTFAFDAGETLSKVLEALNAHYVDKIDQELITKMSLNLTKGMLRELGDSNSKYLDKEEMNLLQESQDGIFQGIGVRTVIGTEKYDNTINEEVLIIGSVIPETSAAKAGLKAGDKILSVNGKIVIPYNPYARLEKKVDEYRRHPDDEKQKEVQSFIESENKRLEQSIPILLAEQEISMGSGKEIKLEIKQGNNKKQVVLKTEKISLKPIKEDILHKNYMYIGINSLCNDLPNAIKSSIEKANKDSKINAIILDLRNVFGGTYKISSETMKYFTPNATLGELITQKHEPFNMIIPIYENPLKNKKLIVLINQGTAKYGELMAKTLQKSGKGILVGEKTSGNLEDISIFGLENGGGYTITSGEFRFSSTDKSKLVTPDINLNLPQNYSDIEKSTLDKFLK